MKLTEAKLKELILEAMGTMLPQGITDLLSTGEIAMAVVLLQDTQKTLPWAQGKKIIDPGDGKGFRIEGGSLIDLINLARDLGLQIYNAGPKSGEEGIPFVDVMLPPPPYEEEEIDYEGGEDAPYDDGSEWKSNVHPKR